MKYAAKKIVWMLLTMVIVSFLAFLAFRIIPGDPTAKLLGEQATPERVEALIAEGFDVIPAPGNVGDALAAATERLGAAGNFQHRRHMAQDFLAALTHRRKQSAGQQLGQMSG